ncbi:MAG: GNAT family N-acetyltransferase [Actinobacteria bacterium]|nr:GNAT family N-acetyltransferase [Actinomycetota bacterium]
MTFPVVDGLRSIEFGTPGESRARLVDFIINGNKRATAGLLHDYAKEGELVEHVDECLAMVDNVGQHVATLQVRRVEVTRFADVPDEFALAEAEGDLNAADFRASHLEYWTRVGEAITDETQVVQVYFNLLTHRLRPLRLDDAEWIHRACQDPEVQRWTLVPRPYTGYWVAPWARRRGAASTALKILPTIAARLGSARTVQATIAETNTASRRAAERAGFELAGTSGEQCPDGDCQVVGLEYRRTI